jgi:rhodanese-related sulfurtransferase/rubrerythrin
MRWRQFLTPVTSLNFEQCKTYLDGTPADDVTILDVRQPNEYQSGHIPGAKLIPLPQLGDRIQELDPQKPVVVYCAIGGRSRVAAQMLAGKGFEEVYNLTGGIRAWNSQTAIGGEDMGLMLFNGQESVTQCLFIAYSLEGGLREYYETMAEKVEQTEIKELFKKLAAIEVQHQDRIFDEYAKLIDVLADREKFNNAIESKFAEGGLTTQEFGQLYEPDWHSPVDVISLAMAIEAQGLDLYLRAARRTKDQAAQEALNRLANEEISHMKQLGNLIEKLQSE